LKIGDKVRVIGVPPELPEGGEIKTRLLFEAGVGMIFPVAGFNGHLLELEVGEVRGQLPCIDSIWIEPEFVELIESEKLNS
jgi:hypothetical protein